MTLAISPLVNGEPVRSGPVEAELASDSSVIVAGRPFTVALRLKMAPHWHTYWENPGESGMPTKIRWALPEGFSAGALRYPAPKRYELAGFVTFAHEGEVFLLTEIQPPASLAAGSSVTIMGTASWLACDPNRCVPGRAELSLTLKVAAEGSKPNQWTARITKARASLPAPLVADRQGVVLTAKLPDDRESAAAKSGVFFPSTPGVKPDSSVVVKDLRATVSLQKAGDDPIPATVAGVLVLDSGKAFALQTP